MSPSGAPSYATMLHDVVDRRPEAEALVFPDARVTYGALMERAVWRARELRALGVTRGDRFGMLLPNSPALVEFLVGATLIGAVAVPINTRFKATEIAHVVTDGRLRAVVTTGAVDEHTSFRQLLYRALPDLQGASTPTDLRLATAPELRAVALLEEDPSPGIVATSDLRAAAAAQSPPTEADAADPDEPMVIMYTSGTTAAPKGCVTRNGALVGNAQATAERFAIPEEDRWWDPLPMFHMGGILLMSAVFSRGATFISMEHFSAGPALDLIEAERATVLYPLFPTITLELLHHPRFPTVPQHQIRAIGNVSPPDVQRQIQAAFPGATLVSAYGMTELCGTMTYSRLDDTAEQRLTSAGRLLPGWEARIVEPATGEPVAPGEPGELVARGPALFAGYFGAPEQTQATVDAAGWFHTGDHCSLDEEGLLYFHGRLKDQLKVGGENVSALEVESFLATHPAIKLAQVVAVPDERYGEVPAAFVELAPGATLTESDVVRYCTDQIARFKIPRYVRFTASWPMSSTKIQKFRLREQLLQELDGPSPATSTPSP